MRSNPLRLHVSTLFGAIALTSGFLVSCSASAGKNLAESSPESKMEMNHDMKKGGMNHSMNMDLGPADEYYDLRFIDGMVPHHEGAVVMAQEVLKKSKRPELLELAKGIIKAQETEIVMMKTWRKTWYPKVDAVPMAWHSEMKHMMPMPAEQMKSMRMDMNLGKADDTFDLRFINAMIPHHEGALDMAKDAIGKSKRPEMKKEAQDILSSQAAEIKQMKQWRKDWFNQ